MRDWRSDYILPAAESQCSRAPGSLGIPRLSLKGGRPAGVAKPPGPVYQCPMTKPRGSSDTRTDSSGPPATVAIKVFGGLRQLMGGLGSIDAPVPSPATVSGLLAELDDSHPDLAFRLRGGLEEGYLNALINGRNVRFLNGLDSELSAADSIAFLPPVGGG